MTFVISASDYLYNSLSERSSIVQLKIESHDK